MNMEIKLLKANVDDAEELHAMKVRAFRELLEKYQDFDTSPASEGVEKVEGRLKQKLCEEIHGAEDWELDTTLQEPKNCYLYEKMGYRQTGKKEVVNESIFAK